MKAADLKNMLEDLSVQMDGQLAAANELELQLAQEEVDKQKLLALLRYWHSVLAKQDLEVELSAVFEETLSVLAAHSGEPRLSKATRDFAPCTAEQIYAVERECLGHRLIGPSKLPNVAWQGHLGCFGVWSGNLFLGIETDGHIHT